jgi:hypothetical protein
MARQTGTLTVSGKVGDLSFYHHKVYGELVRRKGGAKNGKIGERTRENATEFGNASRTGKLIRRGVRAGLGLTGDSTFSQRLNKQLMLILQRDMNGARGHRRVEAGFADPESPLLLRSFPFHEKHPLDRVLRVPASCSSSGSFTITNFVPGQDLVFPAAATHVQLQGATLFADAAEDNYTTFSTLKVVLELNDQSQQVVLEPEAAPDGAGIRVAVLGIVFLQEVNGEKVVLREGMTVGVV